jgi:transposase
MSMSRLIAANVNQLCLVPSEPGWLLPMDHRVRVFTEIVEQELDLLSVALVSMGVLALKLVLYGYIVGLTSSRAIEQACIERIDFRFITVG